MRMMVMVVVLAASGCVGGEGGDDDAGPDDLIEAPPVPESGPCRTYEDLSDATWRGVPPYVAAMRTGVRIVVDDLGFVPLWGARDAYPIGAAPTGTLVWGPREIHQPDGSVRVGAVGEDRAELGRCYWVDAAIVLE